MRKKVTEETKKIIQELISKGMTYKAIANILNFSVETIRYNANPTSNKSRKRYMMKYVNSRYNTDKEFKEKMKEANRIHQKQRYRTDEEFKKKKLEQARKQYKRKKEMNNERL